jgi:hypothetical protein
VKNSPVLAVTNGYDTVFSQRLRGFTPILPCGAIATGENQPCVGNYVYAINNIRQAACETSARGLPSADENPARFLAAHTTFL